MTNKITQVNVVLYLGTKQHISIIGSYLHQGFFSCQGEFKSCLFIPILPI